MTRKLTLTIEEDVITSAKKNALKNGKSLSKMVENYMKTLDAEIEDEEIPFEVSRLIGVIDLPKNFNYKKFMAEGMTKKYMK